MFYHRAIICSRDLIMIVFSIAYYVVELCNDVQLKMVPSFRQELSSPLFQLDLPRVTLIQLNLAMYGTPVVEYLPCFIFLYNV